MWFASYLYRRGFVTAEQIVEASIVQNDRRIPLGKLALETKKMSVKQVAKVLNAQTEEGKRFGQLAVQLGFLTDQDVAYLLMVQNDRLPSLMKVLIEMGAIDQETADIEFGNARQAAAANGERLTLAPSRA